MARAKMIEEPHEIFVGANGKKTFGIQVEALCSPAESKAHGYQHSWHINDFVFLNSKPEELMEFLGIDQAEYCRIAGLFQALLSKNDKVGNEIAKQ